MTLNAVCLSGVDVPIDALHLLWTLEARGFSMHVDGEGTLHVQPGAQLTDSDCDNIRRFVRPLKALVRTTAQSRYAVQ